MIKRLCISGYKPHELGIMNNNHKGIYYIKKVLKKQLISFLEDNSSTEFWILISGQLGVELWSAEVALDLKEEYPQIRLAIFTPFLNQEETWSEEKQNMYREIVYQSDFVKSVSNQRYVGGWQFFNKNKFILEHSDALLVLYDDEKEGSPRYMIQEAVANNVDIHYIRPDDIQNIVEEEMYNTYM